MTSEPFAALSLVERHSPEALVVGHEKTLARIQKGEKHTLAWRREGLLPNPAYVDRLVQIMDKRESPLANTAKSMMECKQWRIY